MNMLLDCDEAAEKLGVTEKFLRSLVLRQEVPHIRFSPRCVKFDPHKLDRYMGEISFERRSLLLQAGE